MTETVRHETKALLRAHLSAAASYRHATHRCGVCRQLQRLAMEAPAAPGAPPEAHGPEEGLGPVTT